MTRFDPSTIKKDFPILSRQFRGRPLVYLDSTATTQKPAAVIDALAAFYRESNANIHRGVYDLAEEATNLYEEARARVARFINAAEPAEVIFTRNTTESINLVAYAWARKFLSAGDEVLITQLEHHANFVPWHVLSQERGVKVSIVPLDDRFNIDLATFRRMLHPRVKLVAVTAMSNVLGSIPPLQEMVALAKKAGATVLVDAAQSAPHFKTDVRALDCDFLTFSAHKMLGPTGVGVLWARRALLEEMNPFLTGGEMISIVSTERVTWADVPNKFEAGTPNIADVAAFPAALDYLDRIGMDAIRHHEKELLSYAVEKLKGVPDLTLYGSLDPETQGGVVSFNHKVVHAHDVGTIVGEEAVAIRVGHHCAQPLMKALKVSSTARASFYIYNTKDDVDALVAALQRVNKVFGLTGAGK